MKPNGFEKINSVFTGLGIEASITPVPTEGEDVAYVTVETSTDLQPQIVLNALYKARLTSGNAPREGMNYDPVLIPLGVQPGSITFQDKNVGGRINH